MAGAVIAVAVAAAALAEQSGRPLLLVANQGDHTLSLIDPRAGKEIVAIPVGGVTGHEVAVSADGKLAYVACNFSDQVAVVDLAGWKVQKLITAGKFADGMAVVQ